MDTSVVKQRVFSIYVFLCRMDEDVGCACVCVCVCGVGSNDVTLNTYISSH